MVGAKLSTMMLSLSCCLISGRVVGTQGVRFVMGKCGKDKSILSFSCCMISGRVVGAQGVRFQ